LKKPDGWDQIKGSIDAQERLKPGGHICVIREAREVTTAKGNQHLVLALDIDEGSPFDGYFDRQFRRARDKNPATKWPLTYWQPVTDKAGAANPYFKGLIELIEKDNPGYSWGWNEKTLAGLHIGMLIGEKELQGFWGPWMALQAVRPIPIDGALEVPPPPAQRLNTDAEALEGTVGDPEPATTYADGGDDLPF